LPFADLIDVPVVTTLHNALAPEKIKEIRVAANRKYYVWKKISKGLSAGRVQSVALKLVVDREKEIEAFIPIEYWNIDLLLQTEKHEKIKEIIENISNF
jgi:DNA topoisomerase-1